MSKTTHIKSIVDRAFAARIPIYKLCDKAGVSRATPSRWKLNPESARATTLSKLEKALIDYEGGNKQ